MNSRMLLDENLNNGLNFSVLISVYWKEKPAYIHKALRSIWNDQTLKPSEIILVEDGPLTDELDKEIKFFMQSAPVKIISLTQNQGLGRALNEGLKHCTYELVARMDTDDISKSDRFEKQIGYMTQHPNVSVCSAWIDEFVDSPNDIKSVRKLPETHEEIIAFSKKRCPINHPVAVFRKSDVINCGGYQHCPFFEDYYLWCRMLNRGYIFHNLQESLLLFRASKDMFNRRGGIQLCKNEYNFLRKIKSIGYISTWEMCKALIVRIPVRLMPSKLRSMLYKTLLR